MFVSLAGTALAQREVSISVTSNQITGSGTAAVTLLSQGNENAIGFSVTFNPAVLRYDGFANGTGATGTTIGSALVSRCRRDSRSPRERANWWC